MIGLRLLYTLFGSREEAERVCHILLEEQLVACANLLGPARSLYRWNGALNDVEEWPAILKTTEKTSDAAMQRLAQLHSYDVPAITVLDASGVHPAFAAWVATETGGV